MIEFFDVPPDADEAFLQAWTAAAAPGATLHRALRDDVRPRFAALHPGGPDTGVLLLVEFEGDPALWDPVFARWAPRRGYIDARVDGDVAVIHWSSPLMYQRAVQALGDLVVTLPLRTRAALYVSRR
jgi:hypothetical protein